MSGRAAIIAAARRTPVGRIGGALREFRVEELAAAVLKPVLEDVGIDPADVDEVVLGNAAGPGGNPARVAALMAGYPVEVPAVTVDRQCGSGLEAINFGARLVESGAAEIVVAGGAESSSRAPWRVERPSSLYGTPRFYGRARFAPDTSGDPEMGVAAENVARIYGIGRQRQDRFALLSHQKAVASLKSGRFRAEIVPLSLKSGDVVAVDECPRADTSLHKLARLPAAFVEGGTVTAGNCCPINDGGAAVVVLSESRFRALGLSRGLRIVGCAAGGVDPNVLGMGPVPAVRRLFRRQTDLRLEDVDIVEFNEAFASQVLASLDALQIREDKVNIGGGAIAIGHPYGASGALLVVRLFSEIVRSPASNDPLPRLGLATLGIGGGLGVATLLECV